jgi:hypothetical protein
MALFDAQARTNPKYLSFDHLYVETVRITDATNAATGVPAYRFVKRNGGYPVAGGYAAGTTVYTKYGTSAMQPFGVDNTVFTSALTAGDGVITASATNSTTVTVSGGANKIAGGNSVYYFSNGVPVLLGTVSSITNDTTIVLNANATAALSTATAFFFGPSQTESYLYPNGSTTPLNSTIFKYQGFASVVTAGIAIVEVDSAATFAVDDPVYSTTAGKASNTAGAGVILGRALDAVTTAGPSQFIRVRLAGVAN